MISDMTVVNPGKILFKFSFLIAAGNILQQLYNLADMYIVGHYAGVNSMAAVGSATNAIVIFINIVVITINSIVSYVNICMVHIKYNSIS